MTDKRTVLVPARVQPFHNQHKRTVLEMMEERPVIVVIGSIQKAYTFHDPFTFFERSLFIRKALPAAGDELKIVGLPDFYNGPRWTKAMLEEVGLDKSEVVVSSGNSWTVDVCREAGIEDIPHPIFPGLKGKYIRQRIATGGQWKDHVPPEVALILETEALQTFVDENRHNAEEAEKIEQIDGLTGVGRIKFLYQWYERKKALGEL